MKPYPAFCKNCKFSAPEVSHVWNLRCHNPVVNGRDAWALAGTEVSGTNCHDQREKAWPAKCGMRGALWAAKEKPE
jgi:5-methylcytosine-specific restriction endonuclease McrA